MPHHDDTLRFDSLDPLRGPRSFRFQERREEVAAWSIDEVTPALRTVQAWVDSGGYAAGFISYEAAPAFDGALVVREKLPDLPLLWFALFADRRELDALDSLGGSDAPYRLDAPDASIGPREYERKVGRILELIAAGDTYQVNFTFRLRGRFRGSSLALYADLARAQRSAFCAYLPMGRHTLVSASPELFFRRLGRAIELRPMKGTRPRGRWIEEDEALASELTRSPKDRAENLMIVDLLRNDVGRIAEFGSVAVPALFEIEHYPTVHQLTSTVTATLPPATHVTDLFRALFPSGSVTGAPKIRTSEIIAELEDSPRGPYTGAIGFLGPDEAVFSVAIRTVLLDAYAGTFELGVGSGLTADSQTAEEYAESLGKGAFLHTRIPDFELLESLRLERPGGYTLLDRHLDRLLGSARYFGVPVDRHQVLAALDDVAAPLPAGAYKVRLLVSRKGAVRTEAESIAEETEPVRVRIGRVRVDERNPFLYHKTTHRPFHDRAHEEAPPAGDVILLNSRGELTETINSNLVVRLDGRLVTPPLEAGLLPGTLRRELLESGLVEPVVLTPDDLGRASEVYVVNSVRGWRRAIVEHEGVVAGESGADGG